MKAYWIDRETNMAKIVETNGKLDELYRMCHCDYIDIAVRYIDGIPLNFVVDDEGLLKDGAMFSVFDIHGEPQLAGSVVVFSCDQDDDDLAGLGDNEIEALMNHTIMTLMTDLTSRTILVVDEF